MVHQASGCRSGRTPRRDVRAARGRTWRCRCRRTAGRRRSSPGISPGCRAGSPRACRQPQPFWRCRRTPAPAFERRGDDVESAPVRPLPHLRRILVAPAIEPDRLGERVPSPHADVGPLGSASGVRRSTAPRRFSQSARPRRASAAPSTARPRASARLPGRQVGDDFQRQLRPPVSDWARASTISRWVRNRREVAATAGAQHVDGAVGLATHQIDDRKPYRDLRPRGALQAIVDLVLQQLAAWSSRSTDTSRSASLRIISSPRRPTGVRSRKS